MTRYYRPTVWLQKSTFKTLAAVVVAGLAIGGCAASTDNATQPLASTAESAAAPSNAAPETIRIGYVRWGLLPIIRQRGVLEAELAKQNIQVEWVGPFPAFAPVLEAFNANSVDISAGGDIPGISGLVGGTPVCVLAYQVPIPEAEAILVAADSPIQSPQDLVGKKVAVNRGGWGEHLLLRVLTDANVPVEQVERVYLGPTDALPAVTQGHVDAWSVWEPNVAIAEVEHDLRPIASGEAASHYGLYVVHQNTLAQKPAVVEATFAEIVKEADWAANNPEEAAKAFGASTDLALPVVNQLGTRKQVETIHPLTDQVLTDLQDRADWMYSQKAIPKELEVSEVLCPATAGLETYTQR
ncbi:aliphatic sulfonate ABC transporter substrate-binding protein [Nodosilinea sp. FACHB-13]|uniref:aliphatic sulfonate ABC transporter substrate-binding protein n=1 Tax=Cyanophyceae TaxID=3028117 RepID=UPI0016840CDB|nr:aliphatic sulfonate ABC transporter substrate-binding protein [Nodosilinea sp. FACHB-13]MBD2108233.1 aliphatic sulfonate ABC transporter substrate-binding protein [Nodosilinea sp. FACHB-13]